MSQIATLDQVVSANVKRLRDDAGLSVSQLADKLKVSRAKVYQYERPRADGRVHSFKWSEMVALCEALECALWELVLPDKGEIIDEREWVGEGRLHVPGAERREELSRIVFHMPVKVFDETSDTQAKWLTEWRDRARKAERVMKGETE